MDGCSSPPIRESSRCRHTYRRPRPLRRRRRAVPLRSARRSAESSADSSRRHLRPRSATVSIDARVSSGRGPTTDRRAEFLQRGEVPCHNRVGSRFECADGDVGALQVIDVPHKLRPADETICARHDELRVAERAFARARQRVPREFHESIAGTGHPLRRPLAHAVLSARFARLRQLLRLLLVLLGSGRGGSGRTSCGFGYIRVARQYKLAGRDSWLVVGGSLTGG